MPKRKIFTDTTYYLEDDAFLCVCFHGDNASLSHPGYSNEYGKGFSIHFTPEHINVLEELIEKLKWVKERDVVNDVCVDCGAHRNDWGIVDCTGYNAPYHQFPSNK